MGLLTNKVAFITGGSRGIGESIVRRFAAEGAKIIFTYRSSADEANKIVDELSDQGAEITAIQSDASSYDAAVEAIKTVIDTHGQIDILVNNAGITQDNLMLRMTEDQWDTVIGVNLKSVFNLTKQVIKPMLKKRSGSIINVSSVVGVFGNAGQANYAASKAGIIGFTKSIAKEIGSRGIRCNAIAPGFIETDMTEALDEATRKTFLDNIPMKRLGTGDDVANACVYLGSDMSTYISGQVLSICGALNT